jgi:hypothetical protein
MTIVGHRKFIVALVALIGNQLLAWGKYIDPGVYSVVAVAVIGSYIAGNVIESKKP